MNNAKVSKTPKNASYLIICFTPVLVLYDDKTMAQGVTKVSIDKSNRFGAWIHVNIYLIKYNFYHICSRTEL